MGFIGGRRCFLKAGATAFEKEASREVSRIQKRVEELEGPLSLKNGVIAELREAYLRCKKNSGAFLGGGKGECELFHIYFVKYSHQRSSWPCYIYK
jgi:hypothetical protein